MGCTSSNPGVTRAPSRVMCYHVVYLFVNGSSGGNVASKLLNIQLPFFHMLNKTCNSCVVKICNLKHDEDREEGFEHLRNNVEGGRSCFAVACGGDGTVKWVISELTRVGAVSVPIGVIPFGTGNDMSRVLGWGGVAPSPLIGPGLSALRGIVTAMVTAERKPLNVWDVKLTLREGGSIWTIVNGVPEEMTREPGNLTVTQEMINYFSCGADAEIVYQFEQNRRTTRFGNNVEYFNQGMKQTLAPPQKLKHFLEALEATTEEGGGRRVFDLAQLQSHRALVFQNIPSYGGGVDLWRSKETTASTPGEAFAPQEFGDDLLECVALKNTSNVGITIATGGLAKPGKKLGQEPGYELRFQEGASVFVQIDGEALRAVNVESIVLVKKFDVTMLSFNRLEHEEQQAAAAQEGQQVPKTSPVRKKGPTSPSATDKVVVGDNENAGNGEDPESATTSGDRDEEPQQLNKKTLPLKNTSPLNGLVSDLYLASHPGHYESTNVENESTRDLGLLADPGSPLHFDHHTGDISFVETVGIYTEDMVHQPNVFMMVNPSSGGNQAGRITGMEIEAMLCRGRGGSPFYVHIANMKQNSSRDAAFKKAKRLLQEGCSNVRFIACGGDGTVKWVISELEAHDIPKSTPIGVIPFGTGNDMARVLGFGGSAPKPLLGRWLRDFRARIDGFLECDSVPLDVWTVEVELDPNDDRSQYFVVKDGKDAAQRVVNHKAVHHMINYLSIGADGQIAYEFEKRRRKTQLGNKVQFLSIGAKQTVFRPKHIRKLVETLSTTDANEQPLDILIRPKDRTLLFMNIPSYGGGAELWSRRKDFKSDKYSAQRVGDNKLELLGMHASSMVAASIATGGIANEIGGGLKRLAQRSTYKIQFKTKKIVFVQVDGEGCKFVHPKSLTISRGFQVVMLSAPNKTKLVNEMRSPSSRAAADQRMKEMEKKLQLIEVERNQAVAEVQRLKQQLEDQHHDPVAAGDAESDGLALGSNNDSETPDVAVQGETTDTPTDPQSDEDPSGGAPPREGDDVLAEEAKVVGVA